MTKPLQDAKPHLHKWRSDTVNRHDVTFTQSCACGALRLVIRGKRVTTEIFLDTPTASDSERND